MDEAGSVDPSCRKRTSLKEAPTSTSGGVTSQVYNTFIKQKKVGYRKQVVPLGY